ncbi:MAG: AAA family ATPase [Devosiaceae bacterium]|nr:AAA family ATPase [Devosiaceae bacterium MH13]
MDTSSVRIPEARIQEAYPAALGLMENAEVEETIERATPQLGRTRFVSPVSGAAAPRRMVRANLESALRKSGGDDPLLSTREHGILVSLRRALAVGMTVSEFFVEPLGYLDLGERKRKGGLSAADEAQFRALVRSRALVAAFVASAHLLHALGEGPAGDPEALAESGYDTAHDALSFVVSQIAKAATAAVDDDDLGPRIARALADCIDRLEGDAHRIMGDHLAAFVARTYAIEADDFHIRGFERSASTKGREPLVMQFKQVHEVVGNHIAKAQAIKLAKMLVAYDFERQKNPFVELGGFLFTFIGDGFPGTGKTTLIQMTAGLVKEYCDIAGYPFVYENFGIDQISEYQGKSGQNARAFIDRVLDPTAIGFGTIDDIDQVAGKRDDRQSSSGQQEVTGVLMGAFSGANTVVRGNASFGMFSNYPEKVDDALRQRAGARWLVDGPQTENDYIDIFHLLLGSKHDVPLGQDAFFSDQALKQAVAKSYAQHNRPQEDGLVRVWEQHAAAHGEPKTIRDVGLYLHAIKEAEPRFTGRAIKNITDGVKYRAMDVELPDAWFEAPETFLGQDYDTKLAMVRDLQKPISMEMILQEINRYADSEFRYSDKSDEAAINELIRDHRVRQKAAARLGGTEGS